MATVFLVKDGPRGDTTSEGRTKPIQEITTLLGERMCQFLGTEPPEFNSERPSNYYSHVVVEVGAEEHVNQKFSHAGFYVVAGLDASQAAFLVN